MPLKRLFRIPLAEAVPHPTTLMKITTRCGQEAVTGLNEKLLAKAAEKDVIHLDKVRADTTVVEANVAYPIDSGLLAKGVARLVTLSAAIKAAGLATRTTTRDRTRSVRRRAHAIAAWLRRRNDDAKEEVKTITGEMATIAEAAIADARHLAVNARRGLRRAGQSATYKAAALVCEPSTAGSRAGWIQRAGTCVASGDVELVAFRVDQQRPPAVLAFMDVDDGRTQAQKAFHLAIVVLSSDEEVEMNPVLHRLGLGHRLEEDAPAHACPPLVDRVVRMAQGGEGPPTPLALNLDRVVDRHVAGVHQAADEGADFLVLVMEGLGPEGRQSVRLGGIEDDSR